MPQEAPKGQVAQVAQAVQAAQVVQAAQAVQAVQAAHVMPRVQRPVRTWLDHACVAGAVAWVWRSSWVVWQEVEPADVALPCEGLVVVA